MDNRITLEKLNISEGARYLGYGNGCPDENIMKIINECERDILLHAVPRYVYRVFDIYKEPEGIRIAKTDIILKGNSISEHLKDCSQAVVLCATLSVQVDKLIKKCQVQDMAKAVIMDSFAGVAIEQVCDKAEAIIKESLGNKYFTFRFGPGYGDLDIKYVKDFLDILNAGKLIGVTVGESYMMTPLKSVACIIGVSDNKIDKKKRGCITCNMRETCKYRARGERCGF